MGKMDDIITILHKDNNHGKINKLEEWKKRLNNLTLSELIKHNNNNNNNNNNNKLLNLLIRKPNWIGHILRRNCLLHYTIEGQMTEVKEVGRTTQHLDDLRKRRY